MIQEFKILQYVLQPEIRLTGLFLCGGSQQCGGVQGLGVLSIDMYWPARLSLAYWPGRQSSEYCWSILDYFFFKSEMYILTYVQCTL